MPIMFNGHTTVIGLTQEGKTYAVLSELTQRPEAVLFFNTKLGKIKIPGYVETDGENNWEQIERLLKKGRKIVFHPSRSKNAKSAQLIYFINRIFGMGIPIVLAIDEVHLFNKKADMKMEELATTGLEFGYRGVFISQRFANIDKTLVTQCDEKVIFITEFEGPYFRNYGLPDEEIKRRLKEGGKYSYVIYNSRELTGPFKA